MNKRFFNQQNLTRRLRMLFVLFAMLLLPLGAWAQTITVAGHSPAEGGAIEGDGITGTVSFNASTNTLTLNGATIGSIGENKNIVSNLGELTIHFIGVNTIYGGIKHNTKKGGTLAFTGSESCSLKIHNGQSDGQSGPSIYYFTSVDFGSFNLASNSHPAPYYLIDETNPNAYQLWSKIIGEGNTVTDLTLTTKTVYPLWIGRTLSTYEQITEDNVNDVLGNGKVSFNGEHTLTLSGAALSGNIISGLLSGLTIIVDGENSIDTGSDSVTCIRNYAPGAALTLQKSNSETPSLSLKGAYVIRDFSSVSYTEGGLYLSAYSSKEIGGEYQDVLAPDAYFAPDGLKNAYRAVFSTENAPNYKIKIGNTSINEATVINASNDDITIVGDGSVTFSSTGGSNILTLDNVMIAKNIISTLPNLTVQYKGSCNIGEIVSTNSNATLTFGLAEGATDETKCFFPLTSALPWGGFAGNPTFNNKLVYIPGSDNRMIIKLMPPLFSMSDGLNFSRIDDGYGTHFDCYYHIDDDVEKKYDSENPETIETACTVTAHVEFTDVFGNTTVSDNAVGKYFEVADKEITLTSETQGSELLASSFVVSPAIAASDVTLSINYSEGSAITYSDATGKATIAGIGLSEVGLDFTPSAACPFEILNSDYMATANVTVVPPAPTFNIPEKEELLNTDKVELVMPEILAEDENASIRYSWVETEADGTPYNSESKVSLNAGTGTLYAWVRWASEGDIILSEKVSHTFENVKSDINQLSVKDLLETSPVYQASAISVPFTLYDPKEETTTIGSDNYDVIYEKYVGGDTGYETVESIVNVGTYIVSVKGKGNTYGGEKLIYEALEVTQTDLANVTIVEIADQAYTGLQIKPAVTVTFNGNAVDTDEYTISYGTNINAGENAGSVTLTSTDTNFSTTNTKTATFNIVAKTLTAAMVGDIDAPTYTGESLTPTVTITDGDAILMKDTHYTVAYSDNQNAGTNTAKATITGIGNYTGSVDKMFTINKAQLTVTPDDKTYNVGDNIELTVSYDGFVDGDDEDVLTTEPTASYGTADITKPGSYEITASGGEAQNYDFVYETGTLTINRQLTVSFSTSNEWATYCGTENLATPGGLTAYQVTAVDGSTVTIEEIGYIPANTAVLLKYGSGNKENISASAYEGETTTFPDNILQGGVAVDVSTITGGTVYVLYKDKFKRATGGTIPANRGYLVVAPSSGNAPELSITIGDGTTSIDNGQLTIDNYNDEWYTLDGQKLQQAPTRKGLYIKNGKKVVINKK